MAVRLAAAVGGGREVGRLAVAGEGADFAAIDGDQPAKALIFGLVNPPLSRSWFWHERRNFRSAEAERGRR